MERSFITFKSNITWLKSLTIGSWDLTVMICFWYAEMIQSRLKKEEMWCIVGLQSFKGHKNIHVFLVVGGSWIIDSLACDSPSWWKPRNLLCSQEFDHIQEIWVLVSGPHCVDNFCQIRVKMVVNEGVFVAVGSWGNSWSCKSPSTLTSICCSSAASCCRASCDTWGAPGKQMMMMLMLSKLPYRDRKNCQRHFEIKLKPWWKTTVRRVYCQVQVFYFSISIPFYFSTFIWQLLFLTITIRDDSESELESLAWIVDAYIKLK